MRPKEVSFQAMLLLTGAIEPGQSCADAFEVPSFHIFTPETENTTHYFVTGLVPKAIGTFDQAMADELIQGLRVPFEEEDMLVIEAVHEAMDGADLWSLRPAPLARGWDFRRSTAR